MKMYKGFDKDLKCRGFQYEIGKEYTEKRADLCNTGFHACENPLDVFSYYKPGESRYCEVDLAGLDTMTASDSKRCGAMIKVVKEIEFTEIVKDAIQYIQNSCSSGATTGDEAHSATMGYGAHSATMGYGAHSATAGDGAHSVTTGDGAHSATKGKNAIAVSLGIQSSAESKEFIVLGDWRFVDNQWRLYDVKAFRVDGEKVKANTPYTLKNGELVEVSNHEN